MSSFAPSLLASGHFKEAAAACRLHFQAGRGTQQQQQQQVLRWPNVVFPWEEQEEEEDEDALLKTFVLAAWECDEGEDVLGKDVELMEKAARRAKTLRFATAMEMLMLKCQQSSKHELAEAKEMYEGYMMALERKRNLQSEDMMFDCAARLYEVYCLDILPKLGLSGGELEPQFTKFLRDSDRTRILDEIWKSKRAPTSSQVVEGGSVPVASSSASSSSSSSSNLPPVPSSTSNTSTAAAAAPAGMSNRNHDPLTDNSIIIKTAVASAVGSLIVAYGIMRRRQLWDTMGIGLERVAAFVFGPE